MLVIGKYMSKCISINKIKRHLRKFSVAKSANDIYWPTISVSNAFSLEDIIEFKENIELYRILKFNQFNIDELNYILVPAGTKVLYVVGITATQGDFEVMLPPGSNLEYIKDIGAHAKVWKLQ